MRITNLFHVEDYPPLSIAFGNIRTGAGKYGQAVKIDKIVQISNLSCFLLSRKRGIFRVLDTFV